MLRAKARSLLKSTMERRQNLDVVLAEWPASSGPHMMTKALMRKLKAMAE